MLKSVKLFIQLQKDGKIEMKNIITNSKGA